MISLSGILFNDNVATIDLICALSSCVYFGTLQLIQFVNDKVISDNTSVTRMRQPGN